MGMTIRVSRPAFDDLLAEAARAAPEECCGILLGREGAIDETRPTRNLALDPRRRFEIDPQALVDAHRAARAGGPQVVGYFHSHPDGPAEPSATDRAHATGDGRVWAIIGEGKVGWWRDAAREFVALSYRVTGR